MCRLSERAGGPGPPRSRNDSQTPAPQAKVQNVHCASAFTSSLGEAETAPILLQAPPQPASAAIRGALRVGSVLRCLAACYRPRRPIGGAMGARTRSGTHRPSDDCGWPRCPLDGTGRLAQAPRQAGQRAKVTDPRKKPLCKGRLELPPPSLWRRRPERTAAIPAPATGQARPKHQRPGRTAPRSRQGRPRE